MKVAYEQFSNVLEWKAGEVGSYVIEDPRTLYSFLTALRETLNGERNSVIFSKDNIPISATKEVCMLTEFVQFNLNQKSILSKLVSELDKNSINECYYQETQKLCARLEEIIMEMSMDFPCELSFDKLNMQSILKAIGVRIIDDYETLEEKLLVYMDVVREFTEKNLFVFVNARCLMDHEKLQLFVDTAITREHNLLFIDNKEYPYFNKEQRLVIDSDLCEI